MDERDVALEAKDSAIETWRVRYADLQRQRDYAAGDVVRLTAKLKVEEKARRFFQARIEAALAEIQEQRKRALAEIQEQRKRAGLPSTGPTPPGVLAMALRLIEEALRGGVAEDLGAVVKALKGE